MSCCKICPIVCLITGGDLTGQDTETHLDVNRAAVIVWRAPWMHHWYLLAPSWHDMTWSTLIPSSIDSGRLFATQFNPIRCWSEYWARLSGRLGHVSKADNLGSCCIDQSTDSVSLRTVSYVTFSFLITIANWFSVAQHTHAASTRWNRVKKTVLDVEIAQWFWLTIPSTSFYLYS